MSVVIGITLTVWMLWAVLFSLGLSSAAARPVPEPARTNRHRHYRRQRCETITVQSPHLDRVGRRRWIASSFLRHHQRQLVSGPNGEGVSQGRRVLADEAMKTHAPFRKRLRNL
jgi:hypothetical protein